MVSNHTIQDSLGRSQIAAVINEDGLYDVIFDSRKDEAKEFRKWVTSEVLPSIRKTGSYSIPNEGLSPQLQLLINMELEQKKMQQEVAAVKEDVGNMRDILSLDLKDWRNGINKLLNGIAHQLGGQMYYQEVRNESYNLLQYKAGCDLNIRLNNRKSKAALRGMSKTTINKISKLDVIAEDKKLISVYVTVIKEMAVKYRLDISRYDLPDV
ncbi:phage antirepressor KilAC domain-containing protein [Exiguobacterium sp. S17]|nr:phage antirepressor KilAC domain-containing protein [Exiguobacterium sp. S17]